jgi:hypothetical protein
MNKIASELMHHIATLVYSDDAKIATTRDLFHMLLVFRQHYRLLLMHLWNKPRFNTPAAYLKFVHAPIEALGWQYVRTMDVNHPQTCPMVPYMVTDKHVHLLSTKLKQPVQMWSMGHTSLSSATLTHWLLTNTSSTLNMVCLSKCPGVTNAVVHMIAAFAGASLRRLDVSQCYSITNTSMEAIGFYCTRLQSLSVAQCFRVGMRGLRPVITQCTRLTCLDMEGCDLTHDELLYLVKLAEGTRRITEWSVSDWIIERGQTDCSQAKRLCMSGRVVMPSERTLQHFVRVSITMTQLRELRLDSCYALRDDHLATLLANLKYLHTLGLSRCPLLTYHLLEIISNTIGQQLRTLVLYNIGQLNRLAVDTVINDFTALERLSVQKCSALYWNALVKWLRRCLRIEWVTYTLLMDDVDYAQAILHSSRQWRCVDVHQNECVYSATELKVILQ